MIIKIKNLLVERKKEDNMSTITKKRINNFDEVNEFNDLLEAIGQDYSDEEHNLTNNDDVDIAEVIDNNTLDWDFEPLVCADGVKREYIKC